MSKTKIDLKENIIKGELAKKINDFEEAHPEIDLGWFNDLIADIIKEVMPNGGDVRNQ